MRERERETERQRGRERERKRETFKIKKKRQRELNKTPSHETAVEALQQKQHFIPEREASILTAYGVCAKSINF